MYDPNLWVADPPLGKDPTASSTVKKIKLVVILFGTEKAETKVTVKLDFTTTRHPINPRIEIPAMYSRMCPIKFCQN